MDELESATRPRSNLSTLHLSNSFLITKDPECFPPCTSQQRVNLLPQPPLKYTSAARKKYVKILTVFSWALRNHLQMIMYIYVLPDFTLLC